MTIVDTSVWIDVLRGVENAQASWLVEYLDGERLALTDLILCEVLQGVRDENIFRPFQRDLLGLYIYDTGGAALAIASAENYRLLRSKGLTVRSTIDCIIATYCIREGHSLLHRDRDYDGFEKYLGLKIIHP